MQYFVEILRYAICGIIIKICGFAICGPAHLRNLQICNSRMSPKIWGFVICDLRFANFKKVSLFPCMSLKNLNLRMFGKYLEKNQSCLSIRVNKKGKVQEFADLRFAALKKVCLSPCTRTSLKSLSQRMFWKCLGIKQSCLSIRVNKESKNVHICDYEFKEFKSKNVLKMFGKKQSCLSIRVNKIGRLWPACRSYQCRDWCWWLRAGPRQRRTAKPPAPT